MCVSGGGGEGGGVFVCVYIGGECVCVYRGGGGECVCVSQVTVVEVCANFSLCTIPHYNKLSLYLW